MLSRIKSKYPSLSGSASSAPLAILPRDVETLIINEPHVVTLNITAPLTSLYITRNKGINRCIYEEQNGTTELAHHRFSDELFETDVVLLGYKMYTEGKDIFMVEDVAIYKGESVSSLSIDKRISTVNTILDHHYIPDPVLETRQIIAKDYVEYEYLKSFYEQASKYPFVNGLRFCPLNGVPFVIPAGYTFKQKPLSFKKARNWQYEERHQIIPYPKVHTCVFSVKRTDKPDVYELYLRDTAGTLRYYDIACIPNTKVSKLIKDLLTARICVMTCRFNTEFNRWTPYECSNKPINCIQDL